MTEKQWKRILDILDGNNTENKYAGFIIDSPWLPNWAGVSVLDYFTSDDVWLQTNLKVLNRFPDIIFLPGFWSEYGMCTEPSAFGAKCQWPENEFPHPSPILRIEDIDQLKKPNPKTDGMLPFVIKRAVRCQEDIINSGHSIKFAISRGPLNIATFLLGTTEFLMALKTSPRKIHSLLEVITDFIEEWLVYQKETFESIEGIFLLDDILGFLGEDDFKEFVLPYMAKLLKSFETQVRFLHNDAEGTITASHCNKLNINLFNFSYKHDIMQIMKLAGPQVALVGNIPPREILCDGETKDVEKATIDILKKTKGYNRILYSCGGGMPPGVPSQNIEIFSKTIKDYKFSR